MASYHARRCLAHGSTLLCLVALPVTAASQSTWSAGQTSPVFLPRVSGPIQVDGRVDDPAWSDVDPLPAYMHAPTYGGAPVERTEFRVAYDDHYLYFACRFRDSSGETRATSLQRDDGSFSNDWCVINLDTFDDRETALVFGTNPAGIRTDVVFSNDATTSPNFSWNTFWEASAHKDPDGWSAEIRIPFSSLRFQNEAGSDRVRMGLAVWRRIARANAMITYPAISPRWGTYSPFKASQFQEVVLTGIVPTRPLYVTPYALGGLGHSNILNEAETGYRREDQGVHQVGLDLKYGLASNLTLDLTFNTDFAQVEADDEQVNLTRFSLFFPEKRLFFQERAAVFEYSLGGNDRLFHSRRIGLVDGEQVPIRAGSRVVGRLGGWDVGFLDIQTGRSDAGPGENLGVLRLRRRILNENSYVGGIVTSRIAEGGGSNVVYAFDALVRIAGQDYLTLNWGQAFDQPRDAGADTVPTAALDRGLARAVWERRGQDGLTYAFSASRAGRAFEPRLGYLRRRDYSAYSATVGYGWRSSESSPLLRHTLTMPADAYATNVDGSIETLEIRPTYDIEFKSLGTLTPSMSWTYERLREAFSLGDATVPAGEYRFATVGLARAPSNSALLGLGASVEAGGYFGGRMLSLSLSPIWNVSRHLTLSGSYGLDDIRFAARNEAFRAHLASLRILAMVTSQLSAAAFVQYNSSTDLLSTNFRFHFNPSEGHDLYVVWNQGINTDRWGHDPVRPFTRQATLLVKYSRTLTAGL
jgi:hypothetical protein